MKPIMHTASVRWTGGSGNGHGALSTESGVLKQTRYSSCAPVTKPSNTNPAELIAAAHAGSFSLALVNELRMAGFVPNHITTIATVTMEHLAAGWTMTNINLAVLARVPKAAQDDFIDATLRAKTGCPISRLLRANISMNAKLESNALAVARPRASTRNRNQPASHNRTRRHKPERLRRRSTA